MSDKKRCDYCGGKIYPARKGEKQEKLVKYDEKHFVCEGCYNSVDELNFDEDID